ncbi:hypothetical protein ILUMI_04543, partial [Ignelater luminosus]
MVLNVLPTIPRPFQIIVSNQKINLNLLTSDKAYGLIDSITDEQAYNSDFGGESDAEHDYMPTNKSSYDEMSSSTFLRPRTTKKLDLAFSSFTDYAEVEQNFDSDYSIIHPNYTKPMEKQGNNLN